MGPEYLGENGYLSDERTGTCLTEWITCAGEHVVIVRVCVCLCACVNGILVCV